MARTILRVRGRKLSATEAREFLRIKRFVRAEARPLAAGEVFGEVAGRFGYLVDGDWRRARCAALAAACIDLTRKLDSLRGGIARRLVAARFDGLPLGTDARGVSRRLQMSPLTLWRAFTLWRRGGAASPAVFTTQQFKCGRRPKAR